MATLRLGSKTWGFLNSHRVTNEIIAKKGQPDQHQLPMPVSSGLVSQDRRPFWEQLMERRRVMHGLSNGASLRQYGD